MHPLRTSPYEFVCKYGMYMNANGLKKKATCGTPKEGVFQVSLMMPHLETELHGGEDGPLDGGAVGGADLKTTWGRERQTDTERRKHTQRTKKKGQTKGGTGE